MNTLGQDFRYGLRMLKKSPGFTAVAIITMALAIGANTAIFSVVYPVLLRPLPYRDPDKLVTVGESRHDAACCSYIASYPDFLDWKSSAKAFEALAGYAFDPFTITGNGEPKTVFGAMVTPNFFSTLGVTPVLGRDFLSSEDLPEGQGPTVVLLSYSFWKTDFAGDAKAVGRVVRLDNKPVTIIGVLPRNFEFSPAGIAPVWVPMHLNPTEATARSARWLSVIGRLAPDVSLQQARADMETVSAQLARQYPRENSAIRVDVAPLREEIVGDVRPKLRVLVGAVALVLLLACANVANLLLSRSVDRRREFAVRSALGASQWHLVLQLLIESLLLSLAGAIVGFAGAALGVWLLVRSIPESQLVAMPYLHDAAISFPVLGLAAGITLFTTVLFGLGPGLTVPQLPITEVLKDESRGLTSGTYAHIRNTLVIIEISISLMLLAGGGLMLQSLYRLLRQNPGFEADHVLTFLVNLSGASYPVNKQWPFSNANGLRFEHELLDRLRHLPGVESASATSGLPAVENHSRNRFMIEGHAVATGHEEISVVRRVDSDYFSVMKIPVLAGRAFAPSDSADHPWVVMVNQAWVKRYLSPEEQAVGKRMRLTRSPEEPFREIVGVIGDVAEDSLAVPPPPTMYFPVDQDSGATVYLDYVVRTGGDAAALVSGVRSAMRSLDPQLALIQPQTLEQYVNRSSVVFYRRNFFYLIGSFALLALVLAMVGLYGLISYSVLQRTREIGVRLALGAPRQDILKIMIRQGILDAVIGVLIGLTVGLGLTRLMSSLLYGVTAHDWPTFTVVSLLLLLVALTASYIPARRATQVDPMTALRNE